MVDVININDTVLLFVSKLPQHVKFENKVKDFNCTNNRSILFYLKC